MNENNIVEVTTNVIVPAAELTGAANLSHVSQYTDIPIQCVSLPLIPLVALDNQDMSDEYSNVILSSVISEAKDRSPDSIVKAHKNTA
ncbi:unnamed protein product [Schistosoma rodhaini]|uniref:Uncharacterized protein n=1 Tax=Schistosoma rodhaini TaxID=6188 RepID=A0AA85GGT9_9TREM|nr:unnamed protein product [Schistosoma rodhaini]CAH8292289.1 unnamed protein product [Schistosoma rodhaini]